MSLGEASVSPLRKQDHHVAGATRRFAGSVGTDILARVLDTAPIHNDSSQISVVQRSMLSRIIISVSTRCPYDEIEIGAFYTFTYNLICLKIASAY